MPVSNDLTALELCGEDIPDTLITVYSRPVMLGTSRGAYFLLLPADASTATTWSCGLTLFAIPVSGDPARELSVAELMAYPRAQHLRVASLARNGSTLRVAVALAGAV